MPPHVYNWGGHFTLAIDYYTRLWRIYALLIRRRREVVRKWLPGSVDVLLEKEWFALTTRKSCFSLIKKDRMKFIEMKETIRDSLR